jgi:lipopolysaccharide export system permease protein
MKKIDKLILGSFIGPFILTFLVVDFILLTQYMLKYFDEFVGKDLGFSVFAEMIGYFCINMTPIAFPLAVLLSSLMTFGNLGEHSELVALKSTGVSLLRVMRSIFIFVSFLCVFVYYSNNEIVPRANLKAYSLLYDIRQTKPGLDIREGIFYNGIPGYSIKVNQKFDDDKTLKEIIIYNHSEGVGNKEVILADSGLMYTFLNERYLMLELFDGNWYKEEANTKKKDEAGAFNRNNFEKSKIVFSLASFDFKKTKEELFSTNRLMRTVDQLKADVDSFRVDLVRTRYRYYIDDRTAFSFFQRENEIIPEEVINDKYTLDTSRVVKINADTIRTVTTDVKKINENYEAFRSTMRNSIIELSAQEKDQIAHRIDSFMTVNKREPMILNKAITQSRNLFKKYSSNWWKIYQINRNKNKYNIEKYKKVAQAFSCLVMFLIGAPLGAIIKRGGLGLPTLISVSFFILFYVFSMWGEKYAKDDILEPAQGVWMANSILLPIGIFFLTQARKDARIFESDYYRVALDSLKKKLNRIFGKSD